MSVRARWVIAALAGVFWVAWLAAMWATVSAGHPMAPMHIVGQNAMMLIAGLLSITWILGMLVTPLMATVEVWHTIGQKVQCQTCTCGALQQETRAAGGRVVIPIRPIKRLSHSDS